DDGRIEGVVRRDGEQLDVELGWQNVSWPPTDEARLESRRGALRVTGTLDDYALALDAELAAAEDLANGAAGYLRAEGRGDRSRFDLALIDVALLDGS